jgi:hypothetical protein
MDVFSQAVPFLVGVLFGSCLYELKSCRLLQAEAKIFRIFEMILVGTQKVSHVASLMMAPLLLHLQ